MGLGEKTAHLSIIQRSRMNNHVTGTMRARDVCPTSSVVSSPGYQQRRAHQSRADQSDSSFEMKSCSRSQARLQVAILALYDRYISLSRPQAHAAEIESTRCSLIAHERLFEHRLVVHSDDVGAAIAFRSFNRILTMFTAFRYMHPSKGLTLNLFIGHAL